MFQRLIAEGLNAEEKKIKVKDGNILKERMLKRKKKEEGKEIKIESEILKEKIKVQIKNKEKY